MNEFKKFICTSLYSFRQVTTYRFWEFSERGYRWNEIKQAENIFL